MPMYRSITRSGTESWPGGAEISTPSATRSAGFRSGEIEDLSELNFQDLVQIEELQIDDIEPLRAELDSFVVAVHEGSPPQVTAEEGLAALECATKIVESISSLNL